MSQPLPPDTDSLSTRWRGLATACPVWVRGAGELGSACAWTLSRAGFPVFLTDLPNPLAIRRRVCFCEALHELHTTVEGLTAHACSGATEARRMLAQGGQGLPIWADAGESALTLFPVVCVDARLLKQDLPDQRPLAPLVIGLGPGFDAGRNCHRVVETMRGHELGRVLESGSAQPDTGIPALLGGEDARRVLHSPAAGTVVWHHELGQLIQAGDRLGTVDDTPLIAPLSGLLRGLLRPGTRVTTGTKLADIDPRHSTVDPGLISDKARCVARGVLEAVMVWLAHRL